MVHALTCRLAVVSAAMTLAAGLPPVAAAPAAPQVVVTACVGKGVLTDLTSASEEGPEGARTLLQPVEAALCDLQAVPVGSADAARLRQGRAVLLRGRDAPIVTGPAYAVCKGALVAIGDAAEGEFRPRRIFNLPG